MKGEPLSDNKVNPIYNTFTISEKQNESSESKSIDLKKDEYLLLASYSYINFIISLSESNLAPFFPKEAEAKGLRPVVYGFIISIQEIVNFVISPLVGLLMPKLGIRPIMFVCIFLASTGIAIFGACLLAASGVLFTVLCTITRTMGAIGMAGLYGCTYASIPVFFPNYISQVFGLLETFTSVGIIIGPFIGGLIYEYIGYGPVFYLSGGLMFLSLPLTYWFNPEPKASSFNVESNVGIIDLLSQFRIFVQIYVAFTVAFVIGFTQVSLEPHLRNIANLKSSVVGGIFLLLGLIYGVATCVVSVILPKIKNAAFISVIGLVLLIIGYIFIGPVHFIPIKPSIQLVIACQLLIGTATACCFASAFTQVMRELELSKFKDDKNASSLIGSMVMATFSLGNSENRNTRFRLYECKHN